MIIEATALTSAPGYFNASLDGTVIVPRTRTPLLDGARAIQSTSNSTYALIMRHAGSSADALRTTVGYAASLTVGSDHSGMPVFLPHKVQ
jgi:hypothetical protein